MLFEQVAHLAGERKGVLEKRTPPLASYGKGIFRSMQAL